MNNYTPYGKEWEKEMTKIPKAALITMLRKAYTGTEDSKACGIETLQEAQYFVKGVINDYSEAIIDKDETMRLLGEYTGRLTELFWKNCIKRIKENPELLNK